MNVWKKDVSELNKAIQKALLESTKAISYYRGGGK